MQSYSSSNSYSQLALLVVVLVAATAATVTDAFVVVSPSSASRTSSRTSSSLFMAGFGAAKQKKEKKLKPKQQYDRYWDFKSSERVRVAVRVVESSAPAADAVVATAQQQWYEIGAVKSKDNAYTEPAVIRHRALMAEHARRMFPLQILANDVLEWGYTTMQGDDVLDESWVVAAVVVGDEELPKRLDRLIGFQGLDDPTGFYEAFANVAEMLDHNTVPGFESMMETRRQV